MIRGVDYSFNPPDIDMLYEQGYEFVGRYVGGTDPAKDLTLVEADKIHRAGLAIVLFGEGGAQAALGGYAAGERDAQAYRTMARLTGFPDSRPIFYAVDWDVQPGQYAAVVEYFAGIADTEGANPVGVYGGYPVCEYLRSRHLVQFVCQTLAWSNGRWLPTAHIDQVATNQMLYGGLVDLLTANVPDYGQWPVVGQISSTTMGENMGLTAGTFPAGRRQHTLSVTVGAASATQQDAWLRLRAAWGTLNSVMVVAENDQGAPLQTWTYPTLKTNQADPIGLPDGTTGVNVSWGNETPDDTAQDGLVSVGWSLEYTVKP